MNTEKQILIIDNRTKKKVLYNNGQVMPEQVASKTAYQLQVSNPHLTVYTINLPQRCNGDPYIRLTKGMKNYEN